MLTTFPQQKHQLLSGSEDWLLRFVRCLNTRNRTSPGRHRASQKYLSMPVSSFYSSFLNCENNTIISIRGILKKKTIPLKFYFPYKNYLSHYLPVNFSVQILFCEVLYVLHTQFFCSLFH